MTPSGTLRLQFHKEFTFADAERHVPVIAALGVSHVYASPITMARAGSQHGYDVIDPTRVNPELGGEEGLRHLAFALRSAGLGLIVDIVPNHMAADLANPWWTDVLRHGRESRYATFFDIDWERGAGKVLIPVLDTPLQAAIKAGALAFVPDLSGGTGLQCGAQQFPLTGERVSGEEFSKVLAKQHYRLAWWRLAGDEINWRRFFDINELVSLRQEEGETFTATHALIVRLYSEGLIDGVRVDHIDGLRDPAGYCRKLRSVLAAARAGDPYVVVEKILLRRETLLQSWGTDGTTGYDFMDEVNAVQHDPQGEAILGRMWSAVSGRPADFAPEEERARREIVARSFSGQLDACVAAIHPSLQKLLGGDLGRPTLRRVIVEVLAHFPVYRTYNVGPGLEEEERAFIDIAIEGARRTSLATDRWAVDLIHRWFTESSDPSVHLFQQLSAPIAAKAVEDTGFYRYGRLLSRNDVGFNVERFAATASDFHAASEKRRDVYPNALLATATHDHKRGEDVRARLAVLSELSAEWCLKVPAWIDRTHSLRCAGAPTAGDIAMALQMVVGAWPLGLDRHDVCGRTAFADRLKEWWIKALREAKLYTDWARVDDGYEESARYFITGLLSEERCNDVLDEVAAFVDRIAAAGAVNGLAQLLLKLTAPGVPDIYQGTDLWDFSLVDPDNRRPVDYAIRMLSLLQSGAMTELAESWRDGRIKQAIVARTLALRRRHPRIFSEGSYEPVEAEGPMASHVISFARRHSEGVVLTIVPRLPTSLMGSPHKIGLDPGAWHDTVLRLEGIDTLTDVLSGSEVKFVDGKLPLARAFRDISVALLTA